MRSVLTIAGSDSSGGAGIQADLKTISANGLFGQSAITVLTAQNTMGVTDVLEIDPDFVKAQIDAVFTDITPHAVKIGTITLADTVRVIADRLAFYGMQRVVLDPVMVATSGADLSSNEAIEASREVLFPLAAIITPNIPEAEALSGIAIDGPDQQEQAAIELAASAGTAVLVKGGHGCNDANDVLGLPNGESLWFDAPRIDNPNTHGTGCTLSSAIACGLAKDLDVPDAVAAAKEYLVGALRAGLDLGHGSGPLDHFYGCRG